MADREVNILYVGVEADAEGVRRELEEATRKLQTGFERLRSNVARGRSGKVTLKMTRADLRKIIPKIRQVEVPVVEALGRTIDATTAAVFEDARERVPVDTGRLRHSIRATDVERDGLRLAARVTAGGDAKRSRWISSKTGETVRGNVVAHAAAVEFGRPDVPNYPVQPFMMPAAEGERRRYADRGRKEVHDAVEDALRHG